MVKVISLDTETTGLDLFHGAKPYLVTVCESDGSQSFWEWDVDPETREPDVVKEDLNEVQQAIDDADLIVLQNAKFDYTALQTVFRGGLRWDWSKVRDTVVAAHLLGSNRPKDLTALCTRYLGYDVQPYEDRLKHSVQKARRIVQQAKLKARRGKDDPDTLSSWRIADKGLEEMPSATGDYWKADGWLLRAMVVHWDAYSEPWDDDPELQAWPGLLSQYANSDSAVTVSLWPYMEKEIWRRGLTAIYLHRMKLVPVAYDMERRGVTVSGRRLDSVLEEYQVESERAGAECVSLAAYDGHPLKLPKSGNNKSLQEYCFDTLKLPVVNRTETGSPSLDKASIDHYLLTLDPDSTAHQFLTRLSAKRKRDTACQYMTSYKRYWLPLDGYEGWYRMHPRNNMTGTDTLRWSFSHPNEANVSKQEGFNLRRAFGPAPGREWWSFDAQNIELRIPAFEAQEEDLVEVFLHPDDPPYYGSYHLVVFDVLHPKLFAQYGPECKTRFESTEYQWVKNGDFALIYGAQEETADRTFHVRGAYRKIKHRFPKITALNDRWVRFAREKGYVETIPDQLVDPERGYPLLCSRSEYGDVLPTVPFNYHTSGTAMQWMGAGMLLVSGQLDDWRVGSGFDSFITLQVHDELVVDTPVGKGSEPWKTNLPRARRIRRLMESVGDRIGVPTPVAVEYHSEGWDVGRKV